MSDISLDNLNGLLALLALWIVAAAAGITGIVLLILARVRKNGRPWRAPVIVSLALAAAAGGGGPAIQSLSKSARIWADSTCMWWAPALLLAWLVVLFLLGHRRSAGTVEAPAADG